jgi:MATE family multidrug resistance protein
MEGEGAATAVGLAPDRHPFLRRPHRTFLGLAFPVLVSQLAEPLTGAVDTAFVARLGATPATALGVATTLLSSVVWIFNFLPVGTQTEIAHALARGDRARSREATGLALVLSLLMGAGLALLCWPLLAPAAGFMSPDPGVRDGSVVYLAIRLLGIPAVLLTMSAFGVMRGLQDMKTPLGIAVAINALNAALDALLILGAGPVPALGIAGAAWAATLSQWVGAAWALAAIRREPGWSAPRHWDEARRLLLVGRDLFLRTGLLLLFLLLATRAAARAGIEAGAAHQALRQVWMLTAFLLGSSEVPAQSLVAYFLGAGRLDHARRVAGVAAAWAAGPGLLLALLMVPSGAWVAALLVPASAHAVFASAWLVCCASQPLNALAFVTDGIHWGTGDYRFIRNAMFVATGAGTVGLWWIDLDAPSALRAIWLVTLFWNGVRAAFGMARVWPGIGVAPLAPARSWLS